ncbi:MAG: alpha/beta hydrolase [Bacteroidales bacterium]|nr:alpha/beta hydrolase [Bacteroidales bacterium]
MKRISLFLMLSLLALNTWSQDVSGSWYGRISVMGNDLRLNFHINEEAGQYSATMDSPDQKAFGIPMQSATYQDQVLILKVSNITYTARLDSAGNLNGEFKQAGIKTELYMTHQELTDTIKQEVQRPQDPKPPFPYHSEEVKFKGGGNYELAGTIFRPLKGENYPIAVFISGSGAQNRDEELLDHKPFLVIADYLARKGIASLRYDDRGTAESGGNQHLGSSYENALDAAAAVEFLKASGYEQIGLIGHSEGGLIAPMVASKDSSIAFIISLAGPGVSGAEIIKKQSIDIAKAEGTPEESLEVQKIVSEYIFDRAAALPENDPDSIASIIEQGLQLLNPEQVEIALGGMSKEEYIQTSVQQISNEWMFYFLCFDPREAWKEVSCPVLALNGEKDLQVNADINLGAIQQALAEGKNPKLTSIKYPDLNHLFQHATTGAPSEYAKIEETFSPEALRDMNKFIRKSTGLHQKMMRYIDGGVAVLLLILLFFVLKKTVKGNK